MTLGVASMRYSNKAYWQIAPQKWVFVVIHRRTAGKVLPVVESLMRRSWVLTMVMSPSELMTAMVKPSRLQELVTCLVNELVNR